jgi:hypothetical protein
MTRIRRESGAYVSTQSLRAKFAYGVRIMQMLRAPATRGARNKGCYLNQQHYLLLRVSEMSFYPPVTSRDVRCSLHLIESLSNQKQTRYNGSQKTFIPVKMQDQKTHSSPRKKDVKYGFLPPWINSPDRILRNCGCESCLLKSPATRLLLWHVEENLASINISAIHSSRDCYLINTAHGARLIEWSPVLPTIIKITEEQSFPIWGV